ncbi:Adenylosuccinate synthetase OS=Streptomyces tendae OX=1932 GN=purA PE=3 SV=1 [Streptomyces tendae]
MPALVLLGAQWGDEGKGKATDLLGGSVDYVVRYQGGNNAGHTVVVGDQKYALHLLPSGILSPGCTPVIGNGVVVDPSVLFSELSGLNERGVDTSKLLISGNAHLITPYNVTLDKVTERFLGKRKIGTTGRGIGPTYADKINRVGIRVQDLYDESILEQKVEAALEQKNQLLAKVFNRRAIEAGKVVEDMLQYAEQIKPFVADTDPGPERGPRRGQGGALRGRPGHAAGRRPTARIPSSPRRTRRRAAPAPAPAWARRRSAGSSASSRRTRRCVGAGPVPDGAARRGRRGAAAHRRRARCHHRPRPALRLVRRGDRAVRQPGVNGLTDFFLTKLDVLTGWEQIPVCVAYEIDGKRVEELPYIAVRLPPREAGLRERCRAGARTSPRRSPSPTCRRTRRRT